MIKTTIFIPDDQMVALGAAERSSNLPKVEISREAIVRYATESRRPRPKAIGIVTGAVVNSTNLDDWLQANWHPNYSRSLRRDS